MSAMIDALIFGMGKNLDYARRLLADIPQERMAYQPAPNMNHPAWVFSHLGIYYPAIVGIIRNMPFEDPKGHRFGMTSKPQADASLYLPKDQLLAQFTKGHQEVEKALRDCGPAVLETVTPLERWRATMPKVGIVLAYLLLVHESTHLGQISVWRRVQGMPSV